MKITSKTRLFAILGNPVAHSLSPKFQNAGFAAAGLDAAYFAQACTAEALPILMHSLAHNGGGGNVTVPHKEVAARSGVVSSRVATLGAANVFVGRDDVVHLGNTDVDGILHSLNRLDAPSSAWLILGTGGSARAVAGAAIERGARVAISSRSEVRAEEFAQWAASIGVGMAAKEDCSVAINTTPLGLKPGDAIPLALNDWPNVKFALDLVYRMDGTTPWIDACRAKGMAAMDGRETLLAQGAAAWSLWFPGLTPPWEVMRAALNGRMG